MSKCDGVTGKVDCTDCSTCGELEYLNVSCSTYADGMCSACGNTYNGSYNCFNSTEGPFETGSTCTGNSTTDTQTCSAKEPDDNGKGKSKLALALGLGLGLGLPAVALIAYCTFKKDKRQVLETRLME